MDPYLEQRELFPDLHDGFVAYFREALQARLPAPYYAVIGSRLWVEMSQREIGPDVHAVEGQNGGREANGGLANGLSGNGGGVATEVQTRTEPVLITVPHDEFRETFVEIYSRLDGERLVTVVELLSHSNTTPGEKGRELYLRKQQELLDSQTHLIEIDLLRAGEHSTAVPLTYARRRCGPFDYHVCLHRFHHFEDFLVYPFRLEDTLPEIAVPLLPGDGGVAVDLQVVFNRCYDAGPYRRRVRYRETALEPPLDEPRRAWAAARIEAWHAAS
jgi:hypothetical protein